MYAWVVFLHIVGVFGFLLGHGASFFVAFSPNPPMDRDGRREGSGRG